MARLAAEILKEAPELARRTNTQLAVVAAALVVIGFNIESQFSGVEAVPEAAQPRQPEAQRTEPRPARACDGKSARDGATVSLERCIDAYFRNRASIAGIAQQRRLFEQQREDARNTTVGAEKGRQVRALDQIIRRTEERRLALLSQAADIKQQVQAKVPFELWEIELPVPFSFAPFFCLAVLALALVRIGVVRSAFWRLLTEMQARTPAQRAAEIETHLYDMPFWLWPPPRDAHVGGPFGDLTRVVGWAGSTHLRNGLNAVLAVLVAAAALRLAWAGTSIDLFVAVSAQSAQAGATTGATLQKVAAWSLILLTQLSAGLVLGLLAWLVWPGAASVPEHPSGLPGVERRRLLVSAAAAAVLAVGGGQVVAAAKLGGWLRRPRWRRPRPAPTLSPTLAAAPAGFYRNSLSGVVHYLALDCAARIGLTRPRPSNLRPRMGKDGLQTHPLDATQVAGRKVQPRDLEQAALDLWRADRAAASIDLLLASADGEFMGGASTRAVLTRLDLAAGLAAYEGLDLTRFTDLARRMLALETLRHGPNPPPAKTDGGRHVSRAGDVERLQERLSRWSEPDAWRRRRWNPARPLAWGGRLHRKGAPPTPCAGRRPTA